MRHIISLGAGVQSTTMALMAAHGELTPMPECAIFADTQGEPQAVYEHLKWLMSPNVLPFPVHVVTAGDLWKSATRVRTRKDGGATYIATGIPVFMTDGLTKGIGRRQCTRDFKINPVVRKARELCGLRRIPNKSGILVKMWMGISTDEAIRMKPARQTWIEARWPLIEKNMSRQGCLKWMERNGYPKPPKSACTFCPYHDDKAWLSLTRDELADAMTKERELQAAYAKASAIRGVPFFHASRVPLGQVDFRPDRSADLFGNECEGMCGV